MSDESTCGETYDHEIEVIYEDEDVIQWVCQSCGAEAFEDKELSA